jgi:hypothetical protein
VVASNASRTSLAPIPTPAQDVLGLDVEPVQLGASLGVQAGINVRVPKQTLRAGTDPSGFTRAGELAEEIFHVWRVWPSME